MKQDLKGALILIDHALDTLAAAAKKVHQGEDPYNKMFEVSLGLLRARDALKQEMENRAADYLMGKAIKRREDAWKDTDP